MEDQISRAEFTEYTRRMEDEHTRQNHRLLELEEQNNTIQELVLSVQKLAMNIESMIRDQERYAKAQERIFQRIEALEEKPAKHWDTVVTVILTAIVSGVMACIMANIF